MLGIDFSLMSNQIMRAIHRFLFATRLWFRPNFFVLILLAFVLLTFGSCNYFRVAATTKDGSQVEGALKRDKYIIVHTVDYVGLLLYPNLDKNSNVLTGKLTDLGSEHQFYRLVNKRTGIRYSKKDGSPEKEVHIYVSEYAIDEQNYISIPLNGIERMDVYKLEAFKTILSYSGSIIGIYYGTMGLLSLLPFLF
jgi:hypothetical protein